MKRKWIVIALLLIGIALLCVPVVLAIRETGNTDIIGGAGLHTFPFIFFRRHQGAYFFSAVLGVCAMIAALLVGVLKKRKQ